MATVRPLRMPVSKNHSPDNGKKNGNPPPTCSAETQLYIDKLKGDLGGWQSVGQNNPNSNYSTNPLTSTTLGREVCNSSSTLMTPTTTNPTSNAVVYAATDERESSGYSRSTHALTSGSDNESNQAQHQEIFEADEIPGTLAASGTGVRLSSEIRMQEDSRTQNISNTDEWFNGDSDLLDTTDENKMPPTPPMSLYSHKKPVETTTTTTTEHGSDNKNGSSYLPTKLFHASSSLESSGNATNVSITDQEVVHDGSVSTTASSITPRSMEKPILYSAIGSLESPNAISVGSLAKRLHPQMKGFSKPGGGEQQQSATLLPPLIPPTAAANNDINAFNSHDKSERTTLTYNSHQSRTQKIINSSNETIANTRSTTKPQASKVHSNVDIVVGGASAGNVNAAKLPHNNDSIIDNGHCSSTTGEATTLKTKTQPKPSNLRIKGGGQKGGQQQHSQQQQPATSGRRRSSRRVSYDKDVGKKKRPIEMFRPSCDAYTPRIEKKSIKYRAAEMRTPVQKMATPMGTLQRPNFRDALKRVAMIVHQHIVKIERRFEIESTAVRDKDDNGLFKKSMKDTFEESKYRTPTYKCTMVRIPMARPGMVYGLKQIKTKDEVPSEEEIYEFGHQLFKSVQLSSECSIVCLIYVERLMEVAKVPLLACTWRPIFMCGLLLASKVWQDLSSWNIEFASVYPQYSLDAINRLELNFLRMVKWDLYISSSLYAKYYFALRSLVEKVSFRQRYNRLVGGVDSVAQSEALKIQKRTEQVKEEALLHLSRSM